MSYKKRSFSSYHHQDAGPPSHAPFALYGTPLPAYDPGLRDDGSYVPPWQQEVRDERGRKRLHGAFTGGFSAGYFNTVGSKEGWTPTTFLSSRSNRATKRDGGQKAEDFMDDEDLAEQAESQTLETQAAFAGLGSAGERAGAGERGMFADLFKTTGESMGVKLLQRMGWREGQGIGPKVRRRAEGDKSGETHLFAPENSRMISFTRKTDRKGLGFAGEGRLEDYATSPGQAEDDEDERDAGILQTKRDRLVRKPAKAKKGAFGVGVLNDNGSDDEDPYAIGPQINYNRIIGGGRKKKKGGLTSTNAKPAPPTKPTFISKKLNTSTATSAGFRKCHDGRLPLDGFVLSLEPLSISDFSKHPPPTVPEGWVSAKSAPTSQAENTIYQSTAEAAKASTLDPKARAALLGEQQLPGKSVFDFLSPALRDKIASASGQNNLPQARGEGAPAGFVPDAAERRRTLWDLIPPLDPATAKAALQRGSTGCVPYNENPPKRDRYRYFLELKAGLQSNLPERPKTFSMDEWVREMREFAQAAEVCKPISGLMATRFTSSSAAPKLASDKYEPPALEQRGEDPAEKAAKLGMYGPMTRSRHPFYPSRLLCKRFGVKPPANTGTDSPPDGEEVSVDKRLHLVGQASIDRMLREASWQRPLGSESSGGISGALRDVEGVEGEVKVHAKHEVVDAENNEALEGEKAGEDVFKAIFGSDDEVE